MSLGYQWLKTQQLLVSMGFKHGRIIRMSEELLIDVETFESRVALVQDGAVVEVHLARSAVQRHGHYLSAKEWCQACRRLLLKLAQSAHIGFCIWSIENPLITTSIQSSSSPGYTRRPPRCIGVVGYCGARSPGQ